MITHKNIYQSSTMNQFLIPKRHIVNQGELEEVACSICYEFEPEIVRCSGPCKKMFCLHCATRSILKNNQCPNRCSNPWIVEQIPNLTIHFKCPFNPQLCTNPIEGVDEFRMHTQSCEYIFQQFKQQQRRNSEFLCPKNHRLFFLNEQTFSQLYQGNSYFYQTTINEVCHLCGTQSICTSICKECSTHQKKCVFCVKCRSLPCTKTMCPVGHSYVKMPVTNTMICDFCGVASSIASDMTYRDTNCNFDICQKCYQKLPNQHPLVPLKQLNNNTTKLTKLLNWLKPYNPF